MALFKPLLKTFGLSTKRNGFHTGLSLSANRLALVQLERLRGNQIRIQTALVQEGSAATFSKQLIDLNHQLQIEQSRLFLVLNPEEFNLYNTEPPDVPPEELREAVRWQLKDLVNYDLNEAAYDIFEVPGQGERGRQRVLYTAVTRVETIQKYLAVMKQAHLSLDAIDIPELAYRNIAMQLPADERGVMLLRLRFDSGLITVTHQRNMFLSRRTSVGLKPILDRIQQVERSGELVGHDQYGLPLEVQGLIDKVILEIQRTLDYYTRNFSMPALTHLALAPLEQPLPGLAAYIQANIGLEVIPIDFNQLFKVDADLSPELQSQSFAALGAALRQLRSD